MTKTITRLEWMATRAPAKPEPDPDPGTAWQWCDVCRSWVKETLAIPATTAPGTDFEVSQEWHVCPCCHWRRRGEVMFTLREDPTDLLLAFAGRRPFTKNERLALAADLCVPSVDRCARRGDCPGDCGADDVVAALQTRRDAAAAPAPV